MILSKEEAALLKVVLQSEKDDAHQHIDELREFFAGVDVPDDEELQAEKRLRLIDSILNKLK